MTKNDLTIVLNSIAESGSISYDTYKRAYRFINGKKTVEDLYILCRSWGEDMVRSWGANRDDFETIRDYLIDCMNWLRNSPFAIEFSDEIYVFGLNHIYEGGFRYSKYEFITYYTGEAGPYWANDGIIK